jgi:hypothetical protein
VTAVPDETPIPPTTPPAAVTSPVTRGADDGHLTDQQSHDIARALYLPTLRRIALLIHTLVEKTENGDFAIWIGIAAFNEGLRNLPWQQAETAMPGTRKRTLQLAECVLRRYADMLHTHAELDPVASSPAEWDTQIVIGQHFIESIGAEMESLMAAARPPAPPAAADPMPPDLTDTEAARFQAATDAPPKRPTFSDEQPAATPDDLEGDAHGE